MADANDKDVVEVVNNNVTEENDTWLTDADGNDKTAEEEDTWKVPADQKEESTEDTWRVRADKREESTEDTWRVPADQNEESIEDTGRVPADKREERDTSKDPTDEIKTGTDKEAAVSQSNSGEEVKSKNEAAAEADPATAETDPATAETDPATAETDPAILMSGNLLRQGTINPRWRKSYFVLKDKKLLFVKTVQDDLAKPDGVTDLTLGRGVRSKEECSKSVEWPDDVEKEQCFGVAVEDGTYYLVGREAEIVKKWKDALGKVIKEFSTKTSDNSDEDVEGMPETIPIKIARGVAKVASKLLPFIATTGIVDGDGAEMLKDAGTAIEKQEEMGRNASMTDRVKAGASSAVGAGGKLSHDQYVGVAGDVVKQQLDDDKKMSPQERAAQMVGTASKGLAKTDLVANNEAAKVALQTGSVVADVTKDQFAAGENATPQQRAMRAVGVAAKGVSTIGPVADNEIAKDVLKVGGGVVYDEGKADTDATVGERLAIGVASVAGGAAEEVKNDDSAKAVFKVTEESAKNVEKVMKKERNDKK